MHYLIAFDKFKGAISAPEAANIAIKAISEKDPEAEISAAPLTDGGEGFATIIAHVLKGKVRELGVPGPRFATVTGRYAVVQANRIPKAAMDRLNLPESAQAGPIAFVEMASASGYECLTDAERDPWKTTTIGTGYLMRTAADEGATAIVIGIGGSATNDCGAGALEALGVDYYDRELQAVTHVTPESFKRINTVGSTCHLINSFPPVRIACDVSNPLLGERGATRVFGPQKGLKPEDTERMERTIHKMGSRILGLFGRSPDEWETLMAEPGSGAAGGIGFALRHALPDSAFIEGFQLVSELLDLNSRIAIADCLVTGEGRLDASSLEGKGPVSLLEMAGPSKPVLMFCGSVEPDAAARLVSRFPKLKIKTISDPKWPLEKALQETTSTLAAAVAEAIS